LGLLLLSCEKDKKLDLENFFECSQSQAADSATTAQRLAGTWTWVKQFGAWGVGFREPDKKVEVQFSPDGHFTLREQDVLTAQGTWNIRTYGNGVSVQLSQPATYFWGSILFCDAHVAFISSPHDGTDYYFRRK
jgi:hypothetical protein